MKDRTPVAPRFVAAVTAGTLVRLCFVASALAADAPAKEKAAPAAPAKDKAAPAAPAKDKPKADAKDAKAEVGADKAVSARTADEEAPGENPELA